MSIIYLKKCHFLDDWLKLMGDAYRYIRQYGIKPTIFILLIYATPVSAFEAFLIEDIRLEGLRRISVGTVFNYLPVKIGDYFDEEKSELAITALFKTDLFKDIRLERAANTLVIWVDERPTIAKISLAGNKDIETEELLKALKQVGFAEGRVFNRSLLDKVKLELQHQYFSLGKYAVRLQSTVTPLEHNRVGIHIDVSEGVVARIYQITLVGNQAFSDDTLLDEIELGTTGWFSFFSKRDQYASLKLAADLETIRAYYLDRGYINFAIDSTQVSITPDKKNVYITINLTEGEQYKVSEVKLVGNFVVAQAELFNKVAVQPGQVFSRKAVNKSSEAISDRMGDDGYAFANINAVPTVDAENKTVVLTFFIDPGKRTYVRQIHFQGNALTRDEVLRREMRQMEGGWISTAAIKRSLERLERLGYFEQVQVETPRVPFTDDQVDVRYTVIERPSGNLLAGVGYSQTQGILFNASLFQDNFLGTGKQVGFAFNNSQVNTVYSVSYLNPYIDIHGVSRGFKLFYRTTDAEEANLSRYTMDSYGANLNYGLPITEYNQVKVGFGFENATLKTTLSSAKEVFDFIDDNGDSYNTYRTTLNWAHDTRDRTLLPEKGVLQSLGAEVTLPFSDLDYYKLNYRHQRLYSLAKDYILSLEGQVGYGKGYGDHDALPFFENYTAGGPYTVRGFRENTLGPLDSNRRPLGGNLKVVGNVEIILPVPFAKKINSFRLSTFLDIGNVYGAEEDFEMSELRYATGLAAIWLSPLGVLNFSLAKPLNDKAGDQLQLFQFSIGTTF